MFPKENSTCYIQARSSFGLTMFADKRIVAVGGMGAKENALDSIEELSEDGTQWTKLSKIC